MHLRLRRTKNKWLTIEITSQHHKRTRVYVRISDWSVWSCVVSLRGMRVTNELKSAIITRRTLQLDWNICVQMCVWLGRCVALIAASQAEPEMRSRADWEILNDLLNMFQLISVIRFRLVFIEQSGIGTWYILILNIFLLKTCYIETCLGPNRSQETSTIFRSCVVTVSTRHV